MELKDLFKGAGWRWWLLVLTPAAAVALVLVRAGIPAAEYTATTSVTIAPAPGQETAAGATLAVDSFRSVLGIDAVGQAVAGEVDGVTPGQVSSGLSSERIGASNLVKVSYVGDDPDLASLVLQNSVVETERIVLEPDLATAEQQQEQAQATADAAAEELTTATQDASLSNPLEEYRAKLAEVTQLRVALVQAQGRGESSGFIQGALKKAERELKDLGEQLSTFDSLQFAVDRSREQVASAEDDVAVAQARLEVATDIENVPVTSVTKVPAITATTRVVVAAALLGFIIGAVLLVGLQLMRQRRGGPKSTRAGTTGGPSQRPSTAA